MVRVSKRGVRCCATTSSENLDETSRYFPYLRDPIGGLHTPDDGADSLPEDCLGVSGGDAVVDACGVCDGDGLSCSDCAGNPNGEAMEDNCGICDADPTNDCVQDCNGD